MTFFPSTHRNSAHVHVMERLLAVANSITTQTRLQGMLAPDYTADDFAPFTSDINFMEVKQRQMPHYIHSESFLNDAQSLLQIVSTTIDPTRYTVYDARQVMNQPNLATRFL